MTYILLFLRACVAKNELPPSTTWQFAAATSSSVIRRHIYLYHGEEYYDRCKAAGIPIKIKNLEDRAAPVEMDMDMEDERETFTKELFLAYLLSWIIHDDQVSCEPLS